MIYDFKHQITNKSGKLLEDKVNYFADYFEFSYSNWGHCFAPEIENHKSLLEKILFQFENYTEHSKHYIPIYLNNSLLTQKDLLIKEHYSANWKTVSQLLKKGIDYSDKRKRLKIIKSLKTFISVLDKSLMVNSVDGIVRILHCTQPLEGHNHRNVFKYLTSIILSEFFYAGFTKDDLSKIFNNILHKEIIIENGKATTKAPVPEHLHKLKYENKEEYFEKVSEYLKSRSLKQQFEGIFNFYKNEQKKKTFIFHIENLRFNPKETFNWKYNNVLFSNDLYKRNVKKRTTRKEYADFFTNKQVMCAQVTVTGINNEGAKSNAIREVTNALNYLIILGKSTPSINNLNYIVKDRDESMYYQSFSKNFHSQDKKVFDRSNIYDFLKKYKSPLSVRLKEIEPIFTIGISSIYKEVRLVNLWRYLECFFKNAEELKKDISLIVANNHYYDEVFYFSNTTHKIFDNFNNYKVYEKYKDSKELYEWLYPNNYKDKKMDGLLKILNHPYLKPKMQSYLSKTNEQKINFSSKFITKILNESYEQRNFIEHDGRFNEKSVNKVLLSLENYVSIFRRQLIECVKKSKFKTFDEIIEHLKATNDYPKNISDEKK